MTSEAGPGGQGASSWLTWRQVAELVTGARGERWSEARVGTPGRGRQGSGADPHQGDAGADVGRRRADSDLAAPFVLGTLALDPTRATSFIDPLGRLEVDAPVGAVTPADAAAAGGGLALRIIQLAAGAGSNAGGSGIVSFGTYLVQLVDAHGRLVGHGLRRPLTMTLRLERAASALDLRHAFVVVNWLRPTTLTTRVAATATSAADPAAARPAAVPAGQLALGRSAHLPAALVREAGAADPAGRLARHGAQDGPDTALSPLALVAQPLLPSPSSAISWNTSGAIAYFGKPDIFNADLSAGPLSGSLPIDVPAGPGGLTPPLSLAYGSAGVAENHSVQGAAGWVGEGWTMSLGAINWSEHNISANCRTCAPAIPPSGNGWSAASECAPSVSTHASAADSYDQYGAVTTADRQSDGGSPFETVDRTFYNDHDAVTATATGATGTYLIDLPAYTATSDGGDTTRTGCVERGYDGNAYVYGPTNTGLVTGELTSETRFPGGCGSSPSWNPVGAGVTTTTGYDPEGDPMGTTDGDANAGDATHLGCTANGVTFSACTGYDGTYGTLPASSTNALGQAESTGYTLTTGGGFGQWATSTTDKNGRTTAYAYDLLGRMTGRTLPGDSVQTTTWAYDDWCQSSAAIVQAACVEVIQTQHLTNTATVETRAFYDGYGRLVETRAQAPGSQDVVRYRYYDAAGAVEHDSVAYFVADTGTCGCASDFSIPDSTQAGAGTSYDGAGRVLTTTDAASHVTTTAYTVTTGLNGDTGDYEQTAVTDPLGHQTATLTDAFGRAGYAERYTGSAAPYSLYASTKYYYNLDGTLASILQPGGASTSFSYDSAGRQTGLVDPDRGTESYTYGADGNRLSSVDARGAAGTVWAGYDPLDRQTWRNTTNSPTNAYVTYTYDSTAGGNNGVGHLTGERFLGAPGGPNQGLAGNYAYVYDPRGQQTSETLTLAGNTYTVGTSYDDAGNVTGVAYPDGETVSYDVDSHAGWLAGVTALNGSTQTNLLTGASYTGSGGAAGDLTGASLGNGVYTYAAGYDLLVRPTTTLLTRTSTGATAYYQSRTYDAGSNLSALRTDLQGQTDYQAFCYDEQDRLTWASTASGATPCGGTNPTGTLTSAAYTQSFGYDTLGRLTSGPLGAYSYGNASHLHAATAISSTWTAAYDAAGDMTCRAATSANTCAGGSPTGSPMTWDNEGRLVEWTSPAGAPWSSSIDLYDGEGNRVQQQTVAGGVTTQTYYIGNLEEVSVSGGTTTTTTYYYAGNGGPRIATATNGDFSYLASDTLGTAEVALDANGTTTAAQLYAPYGTTRYSSGTMPGSYGYTGQHADAVTGLDDFGARYYDSTAGQFASADTILPGKGYDVWGLSRYAYVEGNPITRHGTEEGRSKWTRGHALCSLIGTAERQHSAKRLAVKPLIMPRWPAPRPAGQLPPLCGARSGGYTGEAKEAGGQQIGGIMEEPWRRYHERRGWAGQGQGGRYSPCARAAEARPSACTRGRGLAVLALLGLALVAPLSGCASPLGSLFPAPTPTPPCDPFALCKVVLPRCGAPVTSAQFTYGPWYTGLALPRNVPALVGFPPQLPASLPNGLSLYRVAVFGSPAAAAGHLLLHVGYGPFPPREDPSLRGPSRKSVLGLDEAGGPLGPLDFLPTPNEPLEVADQVAATVNGQPAVLYHVVSPRAPASAYEVIELIWKSGPITMRLIATTGGIGVYTTPEPPVTVDSIATWVGVVGDPNTGAKDTALLAFAPRVAPFTGCQ